MKFKRKLITLWHALKPKFPMKQAEPFSESELMEYHESIKEAIKDDEKKERQIEYSDWCEQMQNVPSDYKRVPKYKSIVDIELQPYRWLSLGVGLIESCKGDTRIQHLDGRQGEYLNTYLLYPVFQMGVEIFLKGMWLCQFDECRNIHDIGFIDKIIRLKHDSKLQKLGHDLIKLIDEIRIIDKYKADKESVKFLKIVEGVIRSDYYPLYDADKKKNVWAHYRYPIRFYKDKTQEGKSNSYYSYPQQRLLAELFQNMDRHLERLWGLKANLTRKR